MYPETRPGQIGIFGKGNGSPMGQKDLLWRNLKKGRKSHGEFVDQNGMIAKVAVCMVVPIFMKIDVYGHRSSHNEQEEKENRVVFYVAFQDQNGRSLGTPRFFLNENRCVCDRLPIPRSLYLWRYGSAIRSRPLRNRRSGNPRYPLHWGRLW